MGGKYGFVSSQNQKWMGCPGGTFQNLPLIWFCLIDAMSKRDVRLLCDFREGPFSNRFQWGVASWWLCTWTFPFAPRRLEQKAGVVTYASTWQLGDAILASYSIGPGWPFCFSPAPRTALRLWWLSLLVCFDPLCKNTSWGRDSPWHYPEKL